VTLQSHGAPGCGERRREINALAPWFHNLHLPGGESTAPDHPLGDFPDYKWQQIGAILPADLRDVQALDVGCNAGFYSFELARRGAHVLALDTDEHYLGQARWAARWLDPEGRVEFRTMQVYDLARLTRRFDLVLFLGVLYHLRYPQLALDLVAGMTTGTLVVQTLTMPVPYVLDTPRDLPFGRRERLAAPGWPRAAFVEHSLAGDPTNWWIPDDGCVRAMLRCAGMRIRATPGHEIYVCEPDPAADEARCIRDAELAAAGGR